MSYLKSVDKKLTKGDLMKNQKEIIIDLFYIEHLKVKEIAENVNLSSSYITKIIKILSIKTKKDKLWLEFHSKIVYSYHCALKQKMKLQNHYKYYKNISFILDFWWKM